jgi:2'-5' RNA ligase
VPRLFVGIDFPPELKLGLSKLCAGVPGAKWVRSCKFHLTLRFIGSVDDPTAANINAVLLEIEASSFMLSLVGVGHFGGHTLWVGVEKNPALICLQARIEGCLQRIGLVTETKPYVPHVKLAHLKRRRSLKAFLTENADFRAGPFQVECFSLIESRPGAEGAIYEHKADFALR